MKIQEKTKIEASERAERVWPPPRRLKEPTGLDVVKAFLSDEYKLTCEDDIEFLKDMTKKPELYEIESVRKRLENTLSRLPRDFFDIFASGKRNVFFNATPGNVLTRFTTETFPYGPVSSRIYTIFLRKDIIEADDPKFFDGVVVHELCHVVLDHPATFTWPEEPQERGLLAKKFGVEAVQLALEIGFKEETLSFVTRGAWLYCWGEDLVRSFSKILDKYFPKKPN